MSSIRVLILRVGAMGDVLHALPAVTALRRRRPDWQIDWVVDPRWAPLLVDETDTGPVVSRIHLADTKFWSRAPLSLTTLRSINALRHALRDSQYEIAIDMQGTLRSAVLGRFAAAATFAGYTDPREGPAKLLYRSRLARQGTHVVDQGAALLSQATSLTLDPVTPELPTNPVAEAWADRLIGGYTFAFFAPAAGWGAKQWPAKRFAVLARELAAAGLPVLVNAAQTADPLAQTVADASAGIARVVPCTLPQLIALTRRASLVIGGDSGPIHLAAALGRPLVALFGPTDPARNGPWGPGPKRILRDPASITSHKRVATLDPGLHRITVPQVLEAALAVLGRTP